MGKPKDIIGKQFHYLTVIRRVENTPKGQSQWACRCICGTEKVLKYVDFARKSHPTKSCGCMKKELIGRKQRTHGMSHHPAFAVWHSMKQRCNDKNHHAYHNYGGRGIKVCERWQNSFENFWKDMGASYQPGLDLDRIDNNQGYSPQNCRWTTRRINCMNRRKSRFIKTPYGKMSVRDFSEMTGIGTSTIEYRLAHHWPTELLCAPPDYRNMYMTSEIVVRGTDSRYGTRSTVSAES